MYRVTIPERHSTIRRIARGEMTAASYGASGTDSFELHSCAVGENFGDALHHFICVVAHGDHTVSPLLTGVLDHQFERVLASLFAHLSEQCNVSANNRLQPGADGAEYAAGADHYPPNQS